MIQEIKTYRTSDLVLKVNKNFDPLKLNISAWDRYLDILCGNRIYQKEAIKTAIIFLASGLYSNIQDLVEENWKNTGNTELKNRYKSISEYVNILQTPDKLAANIDLATGTGKSYAIYGIAQIMLGIGLVDKVLVLCPSLTIEEELHKKFTQLSSDSFLINAIPENSVFKAPSIKSADVTIKPGDICIENIHAVYESTGSSISDSFKDKGLNTLVLNDESHHIYNSVDGKNIQVTNIKKWKEFLQNPEFNFKYILGFTGTPYIKNDYFNDVIYRYSLRQAVNDKVVKMIDYVSNSENIDINIKFQEIYDNHEQNKQVYSRIKPLSILITKDIKSAKRLTLQLSEFLCEKEKSSIELIDKKVLVVTSANEHKANLQILKEVDNRTNSVEWIISVSMLTEGWDVKNVFQIVPWEDRAFNSKLLIAQVLGRGLRIPLEYQNPQPRVRVFNHDAWSKNIRGLVDEILEIEMKLKSNPLITMDRASFHFDVKNINYEKIPTEKVSQKKQLEFDYSKGYIELQSQVEHSQKETEYTTLEGNIEIKNTTIEYNTYSIDEIVNKIIGELKIRQWEGKILKLPTGNYSKENLPPKEEIRKIIQNSMDRVGIKGDKLIEKNKHKIESSFNTLLRKTGKTIVYERRSLEPYTLSTKDIKSESLGVGNLRHNSTVFYSSNYENELEIENKEILTAVIEDETFPKSSSKEINNFLFKTPYDLVFVKFEPERRFVDRLSKSENIKKIDSWIKSRDSGFYSVEYSLTTSGGKHSKSLTYNPDFFIKIINEKTTYFIVIEIKADNDISDENKAKYKYAKQHFETLNAVLKDQGINEIYRFHFLSPNSYDSFFEYLNNGNLLLGKFRSDLEDKLDEENLDK